VVRFDDVQGVFVDSPGLGVLLFLPYRHLGDRVLAAVRAAGHPITLAQARVFQRVDPGGSRLTTLARSAQVTKQTAGHLVDVEGGAAGEDREVHRLAGLGGQPPHHRAGLLHEVEAGTDPYADDVSQGGVSRRTRD